MSDHYMALDVHCAFCEMAVMTNTGKLVLRDRCETRIPALRETIAKVRRPRRLTFEEGPLADWLARELRSSVDELVVARCTWRAIGLHSRTAACPFLRRGHRASMGWRRRYLSVGERTEHLKESAGLGVLGV